MLGSTTTDCSPRKVAMGKTWGAGYFSLNLLLIFANVEAFKLGRSCRLLSTLGSRRHDKITTRWDSLGGGGLDTTGCVYSLPRSRISATKNDSGPVEAESNTGTMMKTLLSAGDNLTSVQARVLLGTIACSYGTNTICIKVLEDNLEPSLIVLFRFAIGTIIFLPFMRKDLQEASGNLVKNGMFIGLVNAVGFLAQSAALMSAAASNTAFTASLSVVVVPLIEIFTPGRRKNANFVKFLPAFLAIAGVACLELGGENPSPSVGDSLALVQPIVWGWSYILLEEFLKDCTEPEDSLALTGGMVFAVVLVALVWSFLQVVLPNVEANTIGLELDRVLGLLQEPQVIGALVWTGIFTTGLASLGECVALKSLSASEATIIFASEPIWASVFASFFLTEEFGLNSYIGGFLVIAATIWSQMIAESKEV